MDRIPMAYDLGKEKNLDFKWNLACPSIEFNESRKQVWLKSISSTWDFAIIGNNFIISLHCCTYLEITFILITTIWKNGAVSPYILCNNVAHITWLYYCSQKNILIIASECSCSPWPSCGFIVCTYKYDSGKVSIGSFLPEGPVAQSKASLLGFQRTAI